MKRKHVRRVAMLTLYAILNTAPHQMMPMIEPESVTEYKEMVEIPT